MSIGCFISKNSHLLDKNEFSKHKSYMAAIKTEVELLNMSAISFFILGPLNKSKVSMDYQNIKKYCEENNISIWPHMSYISTSCWNINKSNRHENKSLMWIRHIKDHLVIGKQLGAKGVVLHVPRRNIAEVLETMEILSDCKVINSIRRNSGVLPKLILEFPASKPNDELTYETPEKLNAFVKALKDNNKITLDWGIALDFAHLFAGAVSFKEPNSWHEYVSNLKQYTIDKIQLLHLNGASSVNFGTGKDCHIIPLDKDKDAIWGSLISEEFKEFLDRTSFDDINKMNLYDKLSDSELKKIKNSSLYDIVKFAKHNNVAMIMEINRGSYNDSKCAMDIINGLLKSAHGGLYSGVDIAINNIVDAISSVNI